MKEEYMKRAIELALKGMGHTSPNPMVGCVVVKDDRIVSEGYHERFGGFHAERNALLNCREDTVGADLYVTLEPCCHYGKTPPCTEIILDSGIKRVFVGSMDPNPLVGGKGISILKKNGLQVETGILEEECNKLNEIFFHYIRHKTPFTVVKYAMTMDGKIATHTKDSKWITGEEARKHVHGLRKQYSGIMVGIGTILADDPMLNCRIEEGVNPTRIICDSKLSIPLECNVISTAKEIPTIIAFCKERADLHKLVQLEAKGVRLIETSGNGRVNLKELLLRLGESNIDSVLVEGGGTLHAAVLEAGLAQKVYAYIAPKIIGGSDAKSPVEGIGAVRMADAYLLKNTEIIRLGNDYCMSGYLDSSR